MEGNAQPRIRRRRRSSRWLAVTLVIATTAAAIGSYLALAARPLQTYIGETDKQYHCRFTFQVSRRWIRSDNIKLLNWRSESMFLLAPPGRLETWIRSLIPGKASKSNDCQSSLTVSPMHLPDAAVGVSTDGTPYFGLTGSYTVLSQKQIVLDGNKATYLALQPLAIFRANGVPPFVLYEILVHVSGTPTVFEIYGITDPDHEESIRADMETILRTLRIEKPAAREVPAALKQ